MLYMFLVMSLSVMLIGCDQGGAARDALDRAERLMDSHADSALSILTAIDDNQLLSVSDRARFALLLTQSLDKNHLDPSDDSLISVAVDYYSGTKDFQRQAMANYYQGRVRYLNGNHASAIVSLFKAKEIGESNGLDFWTGMACRGISDIYNESYNSAEELYYAEKEYDFIFKSRRQPYLNYALLDYGRALYNGGRAKESMNIAEQLLDSARIFEDPYLRHESLQLAALNKMSLGEYRDAAPLLLENCQGNYSDLQDSLSLCEVMFETGHPEDASRLLEITSDYELPMKNMIRYKIDRESKRYHEALQQLELIDSVTNQKFKESVSHNLTTSLADYFKFKMKEDELRIKEERVNSYLSLVIAVVIILVIISVSIYLYRKQSKEISEKVLLAEQLSESLMKSNTEITASSKILQYLRTSKYELLEELCSIAYQNNNDGSRRRKVADAVDRVIEELSMRSDKINEWEKNIDLLHNNLFSNFRHDFPKLKDNDYRLFLFTILGLETPTIALLLKENKVETVYNRKRRLKVKISNLENDNRDSYLKFF